MHFKRRLNGSSARGYADGRAVTVRQLDEGLWHNVGVRDARVLPAAGAGWPLVVFSHGNSATRSVTPPPPFPPRMPRSLMCPALVAERSLLDRFGYTYLCELLASHGYVVVAPDHTGNCRFTLLDGKYVAMGGPRNGTSSRGRWSRSDAARYIFYAE
jgi:hypothetical protein